MAKVIMPLMSASASGKLAKSIVFAGWKGTQYVRQLVIPANPQSGGQGDQRIVMGGTGKACGQVAVTSPYATKLTSAGVIPSGQSKQSYLVKYILDHFLDTMTKYTAELANVTGHTAYTSFQAGADNIGLTTFDLAYANVAAYDKALGLWLLFKTAQALGFTGSPYTVTLSSLTATSVHAFVTKLKTA